MAPETASAPSAASCRAQVERQLATAADDRWSTGGPGVHYVVSVTVQAGLDEIDHDVLRQFGGRVQSANVSGWEKDDELIELLFVHKSDDLWTTLLTTMHASWTAGFKPREITARVFEPALGRAPREEQCEHKTSKETNDADCEET